MRFPNALRGVRSIRVSELLSLWALVLSALFYGIVLLVGTDNARSDLLLLGLLGLPLIVLSIVALIKKLIGVCQAARDHSAFGSARTAIIFALVFSSISGIFTNLGSMQAIPDFLTLAATACTLCASVLILKGLIALCASLKRLDLAEEGARLIRLVLILGISELALQLFIDVLPEKYASTPVLLGRIVLALVLGTVRMALLLRYYRRVIEILDIYDPASGDGGEASASSSETPWGVYP